MVLNMTLRHYPVNVSAGIISDNLDDMADGETHMVAVEIFDHPTAHAAKVDSVDNVIGPWVLGPADEVYAWLTEHGHEDFAEQYSVCEAHE